jgi:hypothetical protein
MPHENPAWTSRRRLLAALRRERPDRVPVSLYELDPFADDSWQASDPTYDQVRALARELQDTIAFTRLDLGFGLADPAASEDRLATRTWREGGSTYTETTVRADGRTLRALARRDDGVETSWRLASLVNDEADLDAWVALPYEPVIPDLAAADAAEARLGERGVVLYSVGDPLGYALGLMPFDLFVDWTTTAAGRARLRRLLDVVHERLAGIVADLGGRSRDRIFRFWGPEYAGPSLLAPRNFREFVVEYLSDLIRTVRASGNLAVVHCHGRLNAILEDVAEMGPDGLEPIECRPAATADVTLAEAKRRVGDSLCLLGGIQGPDLETRHPDEIERLVEQAIAEGAPGGGYILLPTSMPITPLDARMEANIARFLEAGRRYGTYPSHPPSLLRKGDV